jgi:WD40-like Beta Propeller Repeat
VFEHAMRCSLVCAAVAAVALACAPAALAAPARIVFAGDGSIYTMDGDGSDRVQLTHGSRVYQGHVYDFGPRWSPSGRLIAFTRGRSAHPLGLGDYRDEVWVMRADGTRARQLVPRDADLLGFMPDGEVLVDRTTRRIRYVAVDPKTGARRRVRALERFAYDFAISPDGKRVAGDGIGRPGLSVARIDGSHVHTIDAAGSEPAWSPDGQRLAWASEADRNGLWCEFEGPCEVRAEIYVADADGSHRRRLTHQKGDDREPSWSPDGKRIAFQSDVNWPYFYTTEIYSIEPDGDCLTWLTNGAIQSRSPDWSPNRGRTAPAGCGAAGRRPVTDLDLTPLAKRHYPLYWFGPIMPGRRLLSNIDVRSRFAIFGYGDCGFYTPERCGRGGYIGDFRACSHAGELLDLDGKPRDLTVRRGALVHYPAAYPYGSAIVFTGVTMLELDNPSYLRRVRPYPSDEPVDRLPPARMPEWFWDDLERTEESYGRTHSEEATAEELGLSRKQVRQRLALADRLRKLRVKGRIECEPQDAPAAPQRG